MRKYLELINCVITMIKFYPLKITLEVSVNKFSGNIFQCKSMQVCTAASQIVESLFLRESHNLAVGKTQLVGIAGSDFH